MDCDEPLWWVGQLGIVVEVLGAGYLVRASLQARRNMVGANGLVDSATIAIEKLLDAVRNQFRQEIVGFVLLTVGLVMQFAGGFRS